MNSSSGLSRLCENAVDVIDREELHRRLEEARRRKRPLRVKAGFDPSAPDIHLGHTVLLKKLRQFQDLGHKAVFIIGDYTAMVGDPTNQTRTRPALSRQQIEKNAKTYQDQAFKILDKDPDKIEILRNSRWLDGPDMFRVLFQSIGPHVTIDQLLAREDFDKRRKAHRPIALRELIYPVLQGYDSVMVKADVELGGTDQKFNLLVGRDLQRTFGMPPQVVMTLPLLVGLDGAQKMSKSLGNHVGVTDSPKDMFGKLMSIPDSLMPMYYDLLTEEGGQTVQKDIQCGKLHPRDAKKALAGHIVTSFYGTRQAESEAREFDRVFRDKQQPEVPEELILEAAQMNCVDLLKKTGHVSSTSGAYRLIQQGGVSIDGEKITDPKAMVRLSDGNLLKVGKKSFYRLIVKILR